MQTDIENYLNTLIIERRLSDHTVAAYRQDIDKLIQFSQQYSLILWQGLNAKEARRFAVKLHSSGLNPKSIQRILSACRSLCQFLIQQGQLSVNPFTDIRAPKADKKLPKTLSVDQLTQLIEIHPDDPLSFRDQAFMELFYSSGLRLAELCNLNLHDLMFDQFLVRVAGKGNKTRDVPIGKLAVKALQTWLMQRNTLNLKDYEAVFVSKWGKRISPRSIQQRLKYWAKKQGLDINITPHMLRHSFASHMLESSGELRSVQELLGHANISTTQIYTHLDFQHLAKVYDQAHPRAKKK
jgi:integrase/recombinase XerC